MVKDPIQRRRIFLLLQTRKGRVAERETQAGLRAAYPGIWRFPALAGRIGGDSIYPVAYHLLLINPFPQESQASGSRHSAQRKPRSPTAAEGTWCLVSGPRAASPETRLSAADAAGSGQQLLAGQGGGGRRSGRARRRPRLRLLGRTPRGSPEPLPIRTFYAARPHPLQSLGCSPAGRGRGAPLRSPLAVPSSARPPAALFRARGGKARLRRIMPKV